MSLEFKIKDWKFEIDWRGMTAEPITERAEKSTSSRQPRQITRRPSKPGAGIRKKSDHGIIVITGDPLKR